MADLRLHRFAGTVHRPRLHHHAGAAAVGIIVHLLLFVSGIVPDLVGVNAQNIKLPEGAFFLADIIGLDVVDENGNKLGTLKEKSALRQLGVRPAQLHRLSLEGHGSLHRVHPLEAGDDAALLVDDPDAVSVSEYETPAETVLELRVAPREFRGC